MPNTGKNDNLRDTNVLKKILKCKMLKSLRLKFYSETLFVLADSHTKE
jgi:hypothetical protein